MVLYPYFITPSLGTVSGMGQYGALKRGLSSSFVPEYLPPSSSVDSIHQNIAVVQRLDQVVLLVRQQAEETAVIKLQQLTSLKTEVEEVKALHADLSSTMSSTSYSLNTPHSVNKKLPKELSVSLEHYSRDCNYIYNFPFFKCFYHTDSCETATREEGC